MKPLSPSLPSPNAGANSCLNSLRVLRVGKNFHNIKSLETTFKVLLLEVI